MNETTVVNIKRHLDFNPSKNPDDIYIGRFHRSARYGLLPESKWYNPYWITPEVTREVALELYREHIVRHPELIKSLHELKGKRLGCWCKPEACHGDVLIELLDEDTRQGFTPGYGDKE